MENEFKVGDKVERIHYHYNGMKVGDVDTIVKIGLDNHLILKKFNDNVNQGGHSPVNFKLYKEKLNMKKFKNKLAVTGSKSLLKAFEEELLLLGYDNYIKDSKETTYNPLQVILINRKECGNGTYFHQGSHSTNRYDYNLLLPNDWDKALQLAAEIEEEIPEYVECIKADTSYTIEGRIYKFIEVSGLHWAVECNLRCGDFKPGEWLYFDPEQCKKSTKEAFEAQNKFKFKQGDWLYSKNQFSEVLLNFKSLNDYGSIATDEYYQMFGDGSFEAGSSPNYENIKNYQLATKKQIERILLKVAKSKYKKDDSIDQRVAYNRLGDICKLTDNQVQVYYDTIDNRFNVSVSGIGVYNTHDGIWATIVPNEVEVKGYTVEKIDNHTVKVGCKTFNTSNLIGLKNFLYMYDGYYNIDDQDWYYKDVNEVIDAFNKM